jgi:hypothetical protein
MGSIQRANRISASFDPFLKNVVKRAFAGCGNCQRRIDCSASLIDLKRAASYLLCGEGSTAEPSYIGRAGAKLVMTCAGCDRVDRCVGYWCEATGMGELSEPLRARVHELGEMDPSDIAALVDGALNDQDVSGGALLKRVAFMWYNCDKKGSYLTTINVGKGKK